MSGQVQLGPAISSSPTALLPLAPPAGHAAGAPAAAPVVRRCPPEPSTLLLQTLAAWRDNGGSATATARQMFCLEGEEKFCGCSRARQKSACAGFQLPQSLADRVQVATLLRLSSPAQKTSGLSSSSGI